MKQDFNIDDFQYLVFCDILRFL